jgi:hypothetical protein
MSRSISTTSQKRATKYQIVVLTNCTSRKRFSAAKELHARSLPKGSLEKVSAEWVHRLKTAESQFPTAQFHSPSELYCGRAVAESVRAAQLIHAKVVFVSAGLGVVSGTRKIPSYSFTVSSSHPDSVAHRTDDVCDSVLWWEALSRAMNVERPLAAFIAKSRARLVLVALSGPYLRMVSKDLVGLSKKQLQKVRILGPRQQQDVAEPLQSQWMPYDARLNSSNSQFRGTESDFPHRALRHFAERVLVKNPSGSSADHARQVQRSLAPFKAYVRSRGQSATDEQLLRAIKKLWVRHHGRRTAMLRDLRDNSGLACEQKRFQNILNTNEELLRGAA